MAEYEKIPSKVAGSIPRGEGENELDLDRFLSKRDQRIMPLATGYAIAAADEALRDAGWKPTTDEQKHRTGYWILCKCYFKLDNV